MSLLISIHQGVTKLNVKLFIICLYFVLLKLQFVLMFMKLSTCAVCREFPKKMFFFIPYQRELNIYL